MKTVLYTISNLTRSGTVLVLYDLIRNLDRTRYTPIILTLSDENENSLKLHFEKLGVNVYCLHERGIKTFLLGGIKFKRILDKIKPDFIHAHRFRDIVLTAFIAPKTYRKYVFFIRETAQNDFIPYYTFQL